MDYYGRSGARLFLIPLSLILVAITYYGHKAAYLISTMLPEKYRIQEFPLNNYKRTLVAVCQNNVFTLLQCSFDAYSCINIGGTCTLVLPAHEFASRRSVHCVCASHTVQRLRVFGLADIHGLCSSCLFEIHFASSGRSVLCPARGFVHHHAAVHSAIAHQRNVARQRLHEGVRVAVGYVASLFLD